MIESIVSTGVAVGCIYALIGITYNVMFSASRVFSFTAGTLGMLGGVLGSLFIAEMGVPLVAGFPLVLAVGALFGIITEIVAVRPVLKSLDQHLYVLSTLALALVVQQFTAIEWGTEARPFPRLFDIARGGFDQQFWLPMLACIVVIAGLELLYRRTLVGHAFLAIAEDTFAARALGLPERSLRMASFALAGVIGALAGFAGGEMLLAFFGNAPILTFYGFVPVALGGMGHSRANVLGSTSTLGTALPFLVLLLVGIGFPLFGGGYWGVIATRACVYWVLVSGLNLVVGFAGQIAIGWVALLTLGAYTTSVLAAGNVTPESSPYLALAIAAVVGAVFGLIIGLPALRLRTFYFAITTLGFATIVTQVALAWQSVTGGGVGVPGPIFPEPFSSQWGFYYFCFGLAAICTWMTANLAASRFGRALTAIRDAEVAAEASGISKPALLVPVFLFSGAVAAAAGGLFASLQSYITPDAFTLDLSVLFFIAILIGGHGSILGPLLGTILLTVLPEFAAPLVAWSTFLYAVLLLVIVLAMPGGIAELLDFKNRRPLESGRAIVPRPELLPRVLGGPTDAGALTLHQVALSFGGVHAIDGLDLEIQPGQVHGLIGPNGSGKTTTLNVISGYYAQQSGTVRLNGDALPALQRHLRARARIARTFQTPRIVGSASVLENVMIGGTIDGEATFVESLLSLPRQRRDEAVLRDKAVLALATVGLERLAAVRADRLQHSELRFTEIARALMLRPAFLLLDEPAAGLSSDEIARLATLILAITRAGTGVLLVEHHPDLIFDICHHVTVLNLGKTLAAGTPAEIRSHREVVNAYLGG